AIEDQDRAVVTFQRRLRLLHRVARALLLGLEGDRHVTPRARCLELLAALADDHHALVRPERIDAVEQVQKQRPAGDRMQHLVLVGAHARALARGKDHDGKAALFAHGAEQWHGTLANASIPETKKAAPEGTASIAWKPRLPRKWPYNIRSRRSPSSGREPSWSRPGPRRRSRNARSRPAAGAAREPGSSAAWYRDRREAAAS